MKCKRQIEQFPQPNIFPKCPDSTRTYCYPIKSFPPQSIINTCMPPCSLLILNQSLTASHVCALIWYYNIQFISLKMRRVLWYCQLVLVLQKILTLVGQLLRIDCCDQSPFQSPLPQTHSVPLPQAVCLGKNVSLPSQAHSRPIPTSQFQAYNRQLSAKRTH